MKVLIQRETIKERIEVHRLAREKKGATARAHTDKEKAKARGVRLLAQQVRVREEEGAQSMQRQTNKLLMYRTL